MQAAQRRPKTRGRHVARTLLSLLLGIVVGVALATGGALATHGVDTVCPTDQDPLDYDHDVPTCVPAAPSGDNWILGDTTADGDTGFDYVSAGSGHDIVEGQDGADHLHGDKGSDVILGGAGGEHTNVAIEKHGNLRGNPGGDSYCTPSCSGSYSLFGLHGDGANDNMKGGADGDTLHGGDGDDMLNGGPDGVHDHCTGGQGTDQFDYCHVHGSSQIFILVTVDTDDVWPLP